MLLWETFTLFLAAATAVAASPQYRRDNTTSVWNTTVCSEDQLDISKEWTNMSSSEKTAYITAEKCLWDLPTTSGLTGATTRFEDLVALHQNMTPTIHAVESPGAILAIPSFIHEITQAPAANRMQLHWTHDASLTFHLLTCNYINSPILDADTGFGGNGSSVDLCVVDGPFANSTVHVGPSTSDTPEGYCLKRKVNEVFAAGAAQSVIDGCMNITDYANACIWCIGASPHTAGHGGIGGGVAGSMGDIYVSPNDPLFYLHHAYIDRLWWKWQSADIETRLYEIGGYTRYPSTGINTTLDYELDLLGLWDNKVVGDVMDPHNSFLCMDYDY
ncbi:uncharacterized protein PAC_00989 [Phialocephala subalpina]|uniref:Tyrosinase copper-binding domain-containing protein n=1 Tax=Phialocephala subalpina TaxID=576137 RepID=A0A1L7WED2_9HELO|nr:uncharacterized protein PAC_00989 [Phialocephala subalpina]